MYTAVAVFLLILFVVCFVHLVPYLSDLYGLRPYPGPFFGKFSDAWLGWIVSTGHRSEVVHQLHEQYGTFVRLAPNHLSICDPAAIQVVYAHGNGTTKSDFYDAFVSISGTRGLFNTRSRTEHTQKRKLVAHVFSQKSALEFEPYTRMHIGTLLKQWDRLCELGAKGMSGKEGGGWRGEGGRVWMDCMPWFNYLAFDIIGDLAFGAPFGMLRACTDTAPIVLSPDAAMASYGGEGKGASEVMHCSAVKIVNERGDYSATIGVLPLTWRPWLNRFVPWCRRGNTSVGLIAGMAIAAISKRLAVPTDRNDLLSKLQQGKDDQGKPLSVKALTADAVAQMVAGSDTTSNSLCAITYHLAANRDVQQKLQAELDGALRSNNDPLVTFEQIKRLPYLEAVVNEGMRVHSTIGIGLPRQVPKGGVTVCGRFFPEGSVLSVPTYTIHRNKEIWGSDADVFRPERWLEREKAALQTAFNPYSFGPRSCIGRNIATIELLAIIATVFWRYDFILHEPGQKLDTTEGFLRKPVDCRVGVERRTTNTQ